MGRIIILLFAVGAALVLLYEGQSRRSVSQSPAGTETQKAEDATELDGGSFRRVRTPTRAETAGERISRLLSETGAGERKLTSVEIAEYLAKYKTNAFTLVTAFSMSGDAEYLKVAAALHPDDPLVQAQVLLHDESLSTEDRLKWTAALKQSSPENSFAHFLAAKAHIDSGNVGAAVQEISAATGKNFDDFTKELALGQEEAYLAAGRPPGEAKALGSAEVALPHLAQIKSVGTTLGNLADAAGQRGDLQSQTSYLEASWQVGNQLREAGRKGIIITDLVGLALENIALNKWPQDVPAEFLERSVAEQQQANRKYRATVRQATDVMTDWLPAASDSDLSAHFDRMRVLGEMNALNWLKNQQP